MYRHRRWIIEDPNSQAEDLAARLKISPIVGQILLNRGISDSQNANDFLRPTLKMLPDPALIPGLTKAADRIAKAIRDHEQIVIYGDYDVDGITATSILWHAITTLGGKVRSYIPHRIDEGYGLNADALRQILDDGAQLVVTVDCGITALEPAKIARERGIDLIITDHHEWHGDPPNLPACYTVVHPRLPTDIPYPNPHLCGAGVAFKLAWGIGKAMTDAARVSDEFKNFLVNATAFAALGTIADVVPLVGENRVLAHYGLGGLKESKLTGIRALIESASLTGQKLSSYDVGFKLAPRLNACGRLGHAQLAVEMMTTATADRAREIAIYLESQNRERQTVEKQILEQAFAQVESNGWASDDSRGLVLASEGWHAGVIGIVASRIVERFCKPTVIIALTNGQGQGSARSVSGFHLAHALEACGQHLLAYGGHEMAAGLKIETSRLEDFRSAFAGVARGSVTDEMMRPQLHLECISELGQISESLVNDLERLGPFGHANRKPLICIENVEIATSPKRVGKTGDHLQLMIRQGKRNMKCIAFGAGEILDKLGAGTRVSLAAEPCINEFNGYRNVELEIKDFRFEEQPIVR